MKAYLCQLWRTMQCGFPTALAFSFALSASASDADEAWKAIQGMGKSVAGSRTLIGACSQFIKSYPEDKRTEEARQKTDEIAAALQEVPKVIRDKGIPLANGCALNLAGAGIFGGKIDLKKERAGLLSPHKPGEPPDANTLEKRSGAVSKITPGMTLSQTATLLGHSEDMFEQADGGEYQKVCFYGLKDGKTAILWFDRSDTLKLLHIAATAKSGRTPGAGRPRESEKK